MLCVLVSKLVVVLSLCFAWLMLAHIQSRVWTELPGYIEQESRVILPTYGCLECTNTEAVSSMGTSVSLCNGCKPSKNASSSSSSSSSRYRAAMRTAHNISGDSGWFFGDLSHQVYVSLVLTIAQKPDVLASWLAWTHVGLSVVIAVYMFRDAVNTLPRSLYWKKTVVTMAPTPSLNMLPTSLHDMIGNDPDDDDESMNGVFLNIAKRNTTNRQQQQQQQQYRNNF